MHMSQLMPLPLTVSCFSKIQIGFTFLVPAHLGSPGKRAVKRVCVCACVCVLHCERGGYCIAFDGGLLQTTSCTIQNTGLHLAVIAAKTTLKGGNVTSAGWQVTLCDPMWHVSSRSSVATLRTAIHLLLTYLLTIYLQLQGRIRRRVLSSVGSVGV